MAFLEKTGVLAVMDTEFTLTKQNKEQLIAEFTHSEQRAVVHQSLIDNKTQYALVSYDNGQDDDAMRTTFTPMNAVRFQATLAEVYAILSTSRDGAVYIFSDSSDDIIGIITWQTLSHYLHQASY
jgi:Mg2+/Co2+ transporter CorB